MARIREDVPPCAAERISEIGEVLNTAFRQEGEVPEPMIRLMLELSQEPEPYTPAASNAPANSDVRLAVRLIHWAKNLGRADRML